HCMSVTLHYHNQVAAKCDRGLLVQLGQRLTPPRYPIHLLILATGMDSEVKCPAPHQAVLESDDPQDHTSHARHVVRNTKAARAPTHLLISVGDGLSLLRLDSATKWQIHRVHTLRVV